MAKRGAQREMNHDNWDQEEEVEEAGIFKQAPSDILKGRAIKKAKRRGVAGEESEAVAKTPSLFKGFTGFTSSNAKPATFSFNTDSAKPLGGLPNGGGMAPFSLGAPSSTSLFGNKPAAPLSPTKEPSSTDNSKINETPVTTNGSTPTKYRYLAQLKALNTSVSKWISDHVAKNGHCILTPIFRDYEKHLSEIELHNPNKKQDSGIVVSKQDVKPSITVTEVKNREEKKEEKNGSEEKGDKIKSDKPSGIGEVKPFSFGSATGGFSFGSAASSTAPPSSGLFGKPADSTTTPVFGKDASKSTTPTSTFSAPATGFSFGGFGGAKPALETKPFSFATGAPAAGASSAAGGQKEEEEEYQPPKPEVQEIKEEGAFYTTRCKLYYQKEGQWIDRGVGNLHLKPCDGKTQLLVRADTNLGNILLNIMLSSSIPLSRQGKNNVSLMCIPNPPIDPKDPSSTPTGMLIRVKTAEFADELLAKMKENQK